MSGPGESAPGGEAQGEGARDDAPNAATGCDHDHDHAHGHPPPATPPSDRNPVVAALVLLLSLPIHVYRYTLSPLIGRNCRYEPTCSVYGLEALKVHGPVKGLWLTLRRISRCHPWGGMGHDPVPPRKPRGR